MYIQSTQNLDKAEDEFLQKILELCDDNDLGNRYQNMIIENGCVIIKVTQLTNLFGSYRCMEAGCYFLLYV